MKLSPIPLTKSAFVLSFSITWCAMIMELSADGISWIEYYATDMTISGRLSH
jgi:hypothetical protein